MFFFPARLVYQQRLDEVPPTLSQQIEASEVITWQDADETYLDDLNLKARLVEAYLRKHPDDPIRTEMRDSLQKELEAFNKMMLGMSILLTGYLEITPSNIHESATLEKLGDLSLRTRLSLALFSAKTMGYPYQQQRFEALKEQLFASISRIEQGMGTDNLELRNSLRKVLGLNPLEDGEQAPPENTESIADIPNITSEKIEAASDALENAFDYIRDILHQDLKDLVSANSGNSDYKQGLRLVEELLASPFNVNDYLPMMIKESGLDPNQNHESSDKAQGYCQLTGAGRADITKYYGFTVADSEIRDPIKNSVLGMLYLHRCREKYARDSRFENLSEHDHELVALAMYNMGPTLTRELWDAVEPTPTSYDEFEKALSDAMMTQLGVEGFTPGEKSHVTAKKDPTYNITYLQTDAVEQYLAYKKKSNWPPALNPKLVLGGTTTRMTLSKCGEVTRYARMIDAIHGVLGQGVAVVPPPTTASPEREPSQTGEYVVKRGDTLWGISQGHGMSVEDLRDLNGLTGNNIKPGQVLRVSGSSSSPEQASPSGTVTLPEDYTDMVEGSFTLESGKGLWSHSESLRKKVRAWGIEGFESTEDPIDYVTREEERTVLIQIIVDFNNTYNGTNITDLTLIPVSKKLLIPNAIYIRYWMQQEGEEIDTEEEIRRQKRQTTTTAPPAALGSLSDIPPGVESRAYVDAALEVSGVRILTNDYNLDLDRVRRNPNGLRNSKDRAETTHIILHSINAGTNPRSDRGYESTQSKYRAHYVVSREGEITLVRDPNDNFDHAGRITNRTASKALWNGDGYINDKSIGIEVATLVGEEWNEKQYEAVRSLVHALGARYNIPANHVLTHSQVACGKGFRIAKPDPKNVDWDKLGLPNNYMLIDYDVLYGDLEANWRNLAGSKRPASFDEITKQSPMFAGLREIDRLRRDSSFLAELSRSEEEALQSWKEDVEKRARIVDYTVKRGDSLNLIARNHSTSVAIIKKYNGLKSDNIRVGQVLKIPILRESAAANPEVIDSNMTLEEAMENLTDSCPDSIEQQQTLVTVQYYSFDGKLHQGQLVVDKRLKADIQAVFQVILSERFPIKKVVPITSYGWSDDRSMADNNTSAFNYRTVGGTSKLSEHAYGFAIDLNPFQNPWVKGAAVDPPGASYNPRTPGTLTASSPIVKKFKELGWTWGGNWQSSKDYQHFEKHLN